MVLIAILCGASSALCAVAFRFLIQTVQRGAFGLLPEWLGLVPAGAIPSPCSGSSSCRRSAPPWPHR
jgi:hypothetical protein